jgi:hypothetical protein
VRRVPFALTEEALCLLSVTYADFAQIGSRCQQEGRIDFVGSLGAYDFDRVRFESTYLRLISIVEAYVDSMCSDLFRRPQVAQVPMFRALIAAAEARASTNWEERKSAFSEYHRVSLGSCERWSELDAGIDIRNAIAHGLGTLTKRQRTHKSRAKMESVGAVIVDDRLMLNDKALARCLLFTTEFVKSVDSKIDDSA